MLANLKTCLAKLSRQRCRILIGSDYKSVESKYKCAIDLDVFCVSVLQLSIYNDRIVNIGCVCVSVLTLLQTTIDLIFWGLFLCSQKDLNLCQN
jgi:hypothetical protein